MVVVGVYPHNLHLASSEQRCWSGGRGILTELSLYCVAFQQCTLHNHNEQFFQVGLLDRALISLSVLQAPLYLRTLWCYVSVYKKIKKLYLLHLPWPGGLTNCCRSVLDTVGWVIRPVKIVPDMTYDAFGGTLNPTQQQL